MRLLLDTVTFLWAVKEPERISAKAIAALSKPGTIRELSTFSLSEIAIKSDAGKLDFSKEDTLQALSDFENSHSSLFC